MPPLCWVLDHLLCTWRGGEHGALAWVMADMRLSILDQIKRVAFRLCIPSVPIV